MGRRPNVSPLALAVETAAELLRDCRRMGAHEAADRIAADLAAARHAIVLVLDAEPAPARIPQLPN
jgi:hypothetical protein